MAKDIGHEETEEILKVLEKDIAKEYAQAEAEVQDKLDNYLKKFEKKDKQKLKQVKEGVISESEYKKWKIGQVAMGGRWREMRDTLAQDFTNSSKIAKSIAFGHMPDVYALNHNYGTFQVEKESLLDTSYTLYDRHTIENLFKGGKFYPSPGKAVTERIKEGKTKAWNQKQIQSVMIQGILQGESNEKIAKRLAKTVGERDRKSDVRNARTMTTCVQNAGRVGSYKRAENMGIDLMQEWLATLDGRTRHEHRLLDGQRVPVGTPFKVHGYEIEYPGDPKAEAFLVYNCRCTLVPSLKGFEVDSSDLSLRRDDRLGDMTYEEWKNEHKNGIINTSDNTLKAPRYGNADKVMSDVMKENSNEFRSRLNEKDARKFDSIFSRAVFEGTTGDTGLDPETMVIEINKSTERGDTVFHESTHWFDFSQKYNITEDWGYYEYNADGSLGKWVSKPVVVKRDASFSQYIASKWHSVDTRNPNNPISDATRDLRNFEKIVGTSGRYDRVPADVVHDMAAISKYLSDRGVSTSDPDFVHIADFISAITWDSTYISETMAGHEQVYWTKNEYNRVAEITAGYNLLTALGREDLISIEKELAPNLMKLIEEEWSKIW